MKTTPPTITNMLQLMTFLLCCTAMVQADDTDVELNQKCNYSMKKNIFTCSELTDANSIKNVDKFITPETHMLIIKQSDKIALHSNHHNRNNNFKQITSYQINDCNELVIESLAFKGLDNLNFLIITGNYLTHLNAGAFTGLNKLEVLNMEHNNITSIEDHIFHDLTNLITLQISDNMLTTINDNTFHNLNNLENLLLSNNKISHIDTKAFSSLGNLKILDFYKNQLQKIDGKALAPLTNLQYLYLAYNNIEKIDNQIALPKLTMFTLNNNELKIIENQTFQLPQVMSIDLANNSLQNIDEKCFIHLANLKHLNLQNNQVANPTGFGTLKERVNIVL